MKPTPILTLRLLDTELRAHPTARKKVLLTAKDFARTHESKFKKKGLDIDLFHNDQVTYSSMQLGSYKGKMEWTAIGKKPVKALKLWYKLFQKESKIPLQNTIEIKEKYTPSFLDYRQKYQISPWLISDGVAKELNKIEDKFDRYDRLEKYLYGNIQIFFEHIGFEHDKDVHFLKINIEDAYKFSKALPVYHGNKKSAFRVSFTCNFWLPQTLRLGQATALGYGRTTHG